MEVRANSSCLGLTDWLMLLVKFLALLAHVISPLDLMCWSDVSKLLCSWYDQAPLP